MIGGNNIAILLYCYHEMAGIQSLKILYTF